MIHNDNIDPNANIQLTKLEGGVLWPHWTGKTYHVNSVTGSDTTEGQSKNAPLASLAHALSSDNRSLADGDVIILQQGHVEPPITSISQFDWNKRVAVIGEGIGGARPVFSITAAAGTLLMNKDDCILANVLVTGDIDDVDFAVTVSGDDCLIAALEIRDVVGQVQNGLLFSAADRFHLMNFLFRGAGTAGTEAAIRITGTDGGLIDGFNIYGDMSVAGISNLTTAWTNLTIAGGGRLWQRIHNKHVTAPKGIECVATLASGSIHGPLDIFGNQNGATMAAMISDTANAAPALMTVHGDVNCVNVGGEGSLAWPGTRSVEA